MEAPVLRSQPISPNRKQPLVGVNFSASHYIKGVGDIHVASSSADGCFMAFHGNPKIHADLPPEVRQGSVEGVGFSASGEAGGLHLFWRCQFAHTWASNSQQESTFYSKMEVSMFRSQNGSFHV